jgi:prolyl-tRNA synthetase
VKKAIEVGNIFRLKTKFTGAFDVKYADADGKEQTVLMGCYGIGPSRVMGAVAEIHSDEKGLRWPKEIAPYAVHLVPIFAKDEATNAKVHEAVSALERDLSTAGYEPLVDDRQDARAGEKFADADLLGMPIRIVVSAKTLEQGMVEWKARAEAEARMVDADHAIEEVIEFMGA